MHKHYTKVMTQRNFVVDLGQEEREAIICDDGMLPAGHPVTTSGSDVGGKGSLCHSFKEHRPLTGQEELIAKCGFPNFASRQAAPLHPMAGCCQRGIQSPQVALMSVVRTAYALLCSVR